MNMSWYEPIRNNLEGSTQSVNLLHKVFEFQMESYNKVITFDMCMPCVRGYDNTFQEGGGVYGSQLE